MRTFMKDYLELCKMTGVFYKKHWLGCIGMNAAVIMIFMAYIMKDEIKNQAKSKFHKEEESE